MHVEINDFQKRLLVTSLETFVAALPAPPPNHVVNPIDAMHDLVRNEVVMLVSKLNGPGDLKLQNTFKSAPEKV